MKFVVGLGNPGTRYRNNRHNVGYMVIEKLKNSKTLKLQAVKSNTFMNESGSFVEKLVTDYRLPITDIYIVHDDLDIPLGSYKIQLGKGPKDHKGLKSIYEELGTKVFWHVRVGVDNRNPDNREEGEKYVLEDFTSEEKRILDGVISKVCKKLATF